MMPSIVEKYGLVPGLGVAVFDPGTLAIGSMAATGIGSLIGAGGTLAGGQTQSAALQAQAMASRQAGDVAAQFGQLEQQEANFQAGQLRSNATQAIAAGQRQGFDTELKTRLAMSSSTARAAASGVNAGFGSPVVNVGELQQRGSYQALMDMFNGESAATGLRNQAAGAQYSGEIAALEGQLKRRAAYTTASAQELQAGGIEDASMLSALGTLAGGAGSMFSAYGKYSYPGRF